MKKYKLARIIPLLLVGLFLISCETQKGRIPSPDWSRGLPLGSSARGTIGMVVDEDGGRVHLSWPDMSGGEQAMRYIQLDDVAEPQIDVHLPLSEGASRTPRLALTDGENVHYLWAFRGGAQSLWTLNYTQLTANGRFFLPPTMLSDPEMRVGSYELAPDDTGGLFVVWEADDAIYLSHLTTDGETAVSPFIIVENGSSPALRVDDQGSLHLIWREADLIMYAQLDSNDLQPAEGTIIVDVQLGTGTSMDGPVIGLSDEWGYVLWSIASRTGLEAGSSYVEYVTFPIGTIVENQPIRLGLLPVEELPHEPYQGDYQMTLLTPSSPIPYSSDFAYQPAVDQGQADEVAIALAMNQQLRQQSVIQIATAVFKNGEFVGFSMAGKTEAFSQQPTIVSDSAGRLYTAWREGGHGQMIFYAATDPDARNAINKFDTGDLGNIVFTGGLEAVVGMMLVPLAFIWVMPGLLLLGIWHMRRDDDILTDLPTLILLILAFISYQTVKVMFWPFMTVYVPFSAWVDIPTTLGVPLQIGVPIIIFIIGLLTAVWMRWQNRPYMSGLFFFFITTSVDALLTLGIYGVNFLGVF